MHAQKAKALAYHKQRENYILLKGTTRANRIYAMKQSYVWRMLDYVNYKMNTMTTNDKMKRNEKPSHEHREKKNWVQKLKDEQSRKKSEKQNKKSMALCSSFTPPNPMYV